MSSRVPISGGRGAAPCIVKSHVYGIGAGGPMPNGEERGSAVELPCTVRSHVWGLGEVRAGWSLYSGVACLQGVGLG